jgi:putative hydrolase of the HAD superfamily
VTIKALIWDLEGVLMVTDDDNLPLTVAKKLNAPYEKVRELFFSDTNDKVDLGEITQAQFNEYILDTLQISRDKSYLLEEIINKDFYIDKDLLVKIEVMRREYKTGLLSNFSNDLRPKIENEWAIGCAFDEIIISCEVGMIKPDPAIFDLMLDRLGVKANESVFIDDRIKNIDGAKEMGFHTIFFTDKDQALEELARILQA